MENRSSQLESRIKGSLWGLPVGDALGAPYEFKHRGTYTPTKEMEVCKTFYHKGQPLAPGSWTDDTSMQLCLAVSLSTTGGKLDWVDLAQRWVRWWRQGYLSVTGECFDIGVTTRSSLLILNKMVNTDAPRPSEAPSIHPEEESSGNGSLMRLSPVPAALHRRPAEAIEAASLQSRITHSSPLCIDSCVLAAAYMIGFYHAEADTAKARKDAVLNPEFTPFADGTPIPLKDQRLKYLHRRHSYKELTKADIDTSGFVLATLQAALWALWHGNTFEEGLLLLLPLGSDVDTVGAVYGQLAGACYGYDSIPPRWLKRLQKSDILHDAYEGIVQLGMKSE